MWPLKTQLLKCFSNLIIYALNFWKPEAFHHFNVLRGGHLVSTPLWTDTCWGSGRCWTQAERMYSWLSHERTCVSYHKAGAPAERECVCVTNGFSETEHRIKEVLTSQGLKHKWWEGSYGSQGTEAQVHSMSRFVICWSCRTKLK